eukprot:EG_transcript_12748
MLLFVLFVFLVHSAFGPPAHHNGIGLSPAEMVNRGDFVPFARVGGSLSPQNWKAAACPLEMTAYSCYWHNASRGSAVEHRPIPTAHRAFPVAAFEELLRCRDVIFVGDSITRQFWQTLACMLRRPDTQYSYTGDQRSDTKLCPFGTEHCRITGGCATFPPLRVRVCFFGDHMLQRRLPAYGLHNDSVFVVNSGYHYHDQNLYRLALRRFTADYTQMPVSDRPFVVWHETPAQHFARHPSGYYLGSRKYVACEPMPDAKAGWAHDWRNRLGEYYVSAAGIPILRLWNVTQPLWDWHVVHNGRTDRGTEPIDCTHYCVPGAPVHWAVLLADLLLAALRPKDLGCEDRFNFTPESHLWPAPPPTTKSQKSKRFPQPFRRNNHK